MCFRVGPTGFETNHRGQAIALLDAGIDSAAVLEGSDTELSTEDISLISEAAAASVAVDAGTRRMLLEGLCLFASGTVLADHALQSEGQGAVALAGGSNQSVQDVPGVLQGEVTKRVAAAAHAMLRLLKEQSGEGGALSNYEKKNVACLEIQPSLRSHLLLWASCTAAAAALGSPEVPSGTSAAVVAVPVVQLSWGDERAPTTDLLPEVLPEHFMVYASCRTMQLNLLALQDAHGRLRQLALFTESGVLSQILPAEISRLPDLQSAISDLREAIATGLTEGCTSVLDLAPFQQLKWVLEAQQHGGGMRQWQLPLVRSLVHEGWFRWQQGLWSGPSALLPAAHAKAMSSAAIQKWEDMAGPIQLHASAASAHASAIVMDRSVSISDRMAKLLQLKLAARHLCRTIGALPLSAAGGAATPAEEVQAAAILVASTLATHLETVQDAAARGQLADALQGLVAVRCPEDVQRSGAGLLAAVQSALEASNHAGICGLLQPVVLPCLQAILDCFADSTGAWAGRGRRHLDGNRFYSCWILAEMVKTCCPLPCRPLSPRQGLGTPGAAAPPVAGSACWCGPSGQVRSHAAAHAAPAGLGGRARAAGPTAVRRAAW